MTPKHDTEADYRNCEPDMWLPDGWTCRDCIHLKRCEGMGMTWPDRKNCDFSPSRFRPATSFPRRQQAMKFRKIPVEVEAVQFTGEIANDPVGVWRRPEDLSPYVVTIHDQRCYLSPGDWILPEPDGVHYYPVKPDVFAATYEPVEEGVSK